MQVALDTNILAYAEGVGDVVRCARAVQQKITAACLSVKICRTGLPGGVLQ